MSRSPRRPSKSGRLSTKELEAIERAPKVAQALKLLTAVGALPHSINRLRKVRVALALLAAARLKPRTSWADAAVAGDNSGWAPTQKAFLEFWNQHYHTRYAKGSYDDVLRGDLIYLLNAGLVTSNRPAGSHDPTGGYGIAPDAADVMRKMGTPDWDACVKAFTKRHPPLADRLERPRRTIRASPASFAAGFHPQYSTGEHGQLLKAIVEGFLQRHVRGAKVLLFEDNHYKYRDEPELARLGLSSLGVGKLPDVIAYEPERNVLFIIESVHSANPVSRLRHLDLERITAGSLAPRVYVSVFQSRKQLQRFLLDISWETEVWLADQAEADHVIHFNGDKYMVPYEGAGGGTEAGRS